MDTSSLVNLYDRLDDQRKEKSVSKTPSFDFGKDDERSEADFKLPDTVGTTPQSDEIVGNTDDTPTLDVTEPAEPTPRLGLPLPTKTFSYRPPQSLIDKMRAQDEIENDPTSSGFDKDYNTFWRQKINHHCDKLKNRCCKHFILDIYCRTVPLDHDYVCKNKRMLSDDIDIFLDKKKMSPLEYLTAAKDETKAPLLQHLLDESDMLTHDYYEKAYKEMTENEKRGIKVKVNEPTVEDQAELDRSLVDTTEDSEYKQFVQTLKEKTRDKIIKDVTNLIEAKDADKDLEFKPGEGDKPNKKMQNELEQKAKAKARAEFRPEEEKDEKVKEESVLLQCMDFGSKKFLKEEIEMTPELNEQMIGLAIRESTLCNIDKVFKMRNHAEELQKLSTNLFLDKGFVFNKENLNKLIK